MKIRYIVRQSFIWDGKVVKEGTDVSELLSRSAIIDGLRLGRLVPTEPIPQMIETPEVKVDGRRNRKRQG
jgi:hypothetical protein